MTLEPPPKSSDGSDACWWFNLKTGLTEFGKLTPSKDRVGPFPTERAAANALRLLGERSKSWRDEEDEDRG